MIIDLSSLSVLCSPRWPPVLAASPARQHWGHLELSSLPQIYKLNLILLASDVIILFTRCDLFLT